ncbi:hypothetical protein FAZ19_11790 [Sphingobacterium alkalisoli]|uniref:Uncharacterized protein n=1 Tax=Sphingobacterium alkalisoli TaxID=1874115 RepID=A0A4U0H3R5_9SPHI|nr:hypothetical protein [Sphingobacterium alkalisoli]TJY65794.1 hypothetical protein FAZ19_11790 [Sphingobacterium alkalisoli]
MKPLNNVQIGTLGGTICSVWASIQWGDILQTAILSAVGACVSFLVSRLLAKTIKKKHPQ